MAKYIHRQSQKIGTAPGSLIFTGVKKIENVQINLTKFDANSYLAEENIEVEGIEKHLDSKSICWFEIIGIHDASLIQLIGEVFEVHPLILEDILNPNQRSKFDDYDHRLAFFLKMLKLNTESMWVETEQISIVIGKNFVLSFQEMPSDIFKSVKNRIVKATTKIRQRGSDYLAFALMDTVIDNYVVSIEYLGNKVENLVDAMMKSQNKRLLGKANLYRRDLNDFRRTLRPALDMVVQFEKSESELLNKKTIPFLRDLQDHIKHGRDGIELYHELLNDELHIFHLNLGTHLNDILRILTIFSVIFIPLTFLAGVYGTNFEYMPEYGYRYAYPLFWLALIVITIFMFVYFKRKKWL